MRSSLIEKTNLRATIINYGATTVIISAFTLLSRDYYSSSEIMTNIPFVFTIFLFSIPQSKQSIDYFKLNRYTNLKDNLRDSMIEIVIQNIIYITATFMTLSLVQVVVNVDISVLFIFRMMLVYILFLSFTNYCAYLLLFLKNSTASRVSFYLFIISLLVISLLFSNSSVLALAIFFNSQIDPIAFSVFMVTLIVMILSIQRRVQTNVEI